MMCSTVTSERKKRGRKKVEKIQVGGKNGERNGIKRLRTRAIRWKKNEQNSVQEAERVSSSAKKYAKRQGRKKKVSRTQKPLYIFREALAPVDWSRPNSNGSTHYDNCILRIYKTKQKTWRQIGRTSATTIRRHPPTPCRRKKAKKVARHRLLRARKYRLAS